MDIFFGYRLFLLLKILSFFVIVIILAKDLGYNIGINQYMYMDKIIKFTLVRIILVFAASYIIIEDHKIPIIIVLLYLMDLHHTLMNILIKIDKMTINQNK